MDNKKDVHCGENGCVQDVDLFCGQCRKLLCDLCAKNHNRLYPRHNRSKLSLDKDNCLKAKCSIHPKETCDYICCENVLVCFYCINRKHYGHHYDTVEHHIERLKETLQEEIQQFESVTRSVNKTDDDIQDCKKQFEKCMKYRKMSNLSQYISLLEKEERDLRKRFDDICSMHQKDVNDVKTVDEFKEYIEYTDVQMALLKNEILETLEEEHCPLMFPSKTISFSEGTYLTLHPLGELKVTEKEIAVADNVPSLYFKATENKQEGMLLELSVKLDDLARIVKLTSRADAANTGSRPTKPINVGRKTVKKTLPDVVTQHQQVNSSPKPKPKQQKPPKQTTWDKETLEAMAEYKKTSDGKKFEFFGSLMKMKNDKLCIKLLSENPSAVNRKNSHNSTLLHFAAISDRVEVMKHLIANGADVNAVNNAGYSVLHFASYNNSSNSIRYICTTYPHIIDVRSNKNLTPYQFAVNFKCREAVKTYKEILPEEKLKLK